jgi:hypothetical protein
VSFNISERKVIPKNNIPIVNSSKSLKSFIILYFSDLLFFRLNLIAKQFVNFVFIYCVKLDKSYLYGTIIKNENISEEYKNKMREIIAEEGKKE